MPEGGLEVLCVLTFSGEEKNVDKMKRLLHRAPPGVVSMSQTQDMHPVVSSASLNQDTPAVSSTLLSKEIPATVSSVSSMQDSTTSKQHPEPQDAIVLSDDDGDSAPVDSTPKNWLTFNNWFLTVDDHKIILEGVVLNDKHINFAQALLKSQFSRIGGLASTLQLSQRKQGWIQRFLHGGIVYP